MELHIVESAIDSTFARSAVYSLLAKSFKYPSEQVLSYSTANASCDVVFEKVKEQ